MARQIKNGKHQTFNLSDDVIAILEKYCEEYGATKSAVVEKAIKEFVERKKNKTP